MNKVKDWVFLLFRPKWERRLYKLLKEASCDEKLCLDTVLYDYCSPAEIDGKIFKAGVDAMFIGWIGLFEAKYSAERTYYLKTQNVTIGLVPNADGTTPEFATHEGILGNRTLRSYLKSMAIYISSERVSDGDRQFLKDLSEDNFLGLVGCWNKRQKIVKELLSVLIKEGVEAKDLYTHNFSGFPYAAVEKIRCCLRDEIGVKASLVAKEKTNIHDWATMLAYYASFSH